MTTTTPTAAAPVAGWRQRLRRADTRFTPYAMVAPFFLLFAAFGLFPLLYTAWVSMHDWSLLAGDQGAVGLGNYSELLQDSYFWNAMFNTLGMFVLATVPQLVLAMVLSPPVLLAVPPAARLPARVPLQLSALASSPLPLWLWALSSSSRLCSAVSLSCKSIARAVPILRYSNAVLGTAGRN